MTIERRWPRTLDVVRAQQGAIGRGQLLELGWTDAMIATAVHAGLLLRDHLGTYCVAGRAPDPGTRTAAGLLAAGRDAAVTSTTAARLYGFHGLPPDERIHVLVPHQRVVKRPDPLLVVRRSRIPDPTVRAIGGLAATGPERTIVELGRDLDVDRLTEVIAHALHERLADADNLAAEISRCARTRGAPRVRVAVARLAPDDQRARSRRERSTARLLQAHGLPRPRLGYVVELSGSSPIELDLAYPEILLGIEIDGGRWHRTPQQKRYDEIRQNRLTGHGWGVLRFGERQLDRTPTQVVRAVRAALVQRGHPDVSPG